jgi:transposase
MGQAAAQGEAYWRVHVEAWRASGQSRGEYCAAHGLSRKTFGWWAWRLDRQGPPAPADTAAHFLPVEIAEVPDPDEGGAVSEGDDARIRDRLARWCEGAGRPGCRWGGLAPGPGGARAMITAPPGVRVLVWSAPVDFRAGMDRLAALVQVTLRLDPFAGDVFVFRSRRPDRIKLLVYDGTGLVLVTKRLEAGRFMWPPVTDGVVRLSALQLSVLLSGLPWERLQERPVPRPIAAC